jgi:hypothetical protein
MLFPISKNEAYNIGRNTKILANLAAAVPNPGNCPLSSFWPREHAAELLSLPDLSLNNCKEDQQ